MCYYSVVNMNRSFRRLPLVRSLVSWFRTVMSEPEDPGLDPGQEERGLETLVGRAEAGLTELSSDGETGS